MKRYVDRVNVRENAPRPQEKQREYTNLEVSTGPSTRVKYPFKQTIRAFGRELCSTTISSALQLNFSRVSDIRSGRND